MVADGAFAPAEELFDLPTGWRWVRLKELIDQARGICYGIVQPGTHDPSGVPMINSQDVAGGKVSARIEFRVSTELHKRFRRSTIRGGEILLTLVGANFGQVAIAPPHVSGYNCSRAVGVIPVAESPEFVTLCLRSSLVRRYMDNWANTTAQPTFNLKDVVNLPVPWPPTLERNAIARVLDSLDDKIALNRLMNETVEAMAQALFKDWFIDFGPVRAKMEGRQPQGLSTEIAELFPDSLGSDDVPRGWRVLPLDEIADFLNGLALQKYPADGNNDLPVIKIAQMRTGKTEGSALASGRIPSQYVVTDGDVLFSWSGSLTQRIWTGGKGALNQHLFKVTSRKYSKWMHYLWVDHYLPRFQAIAASKATTMGHIQRRHLTEALVVVPDEPLLRAADSVFAPLLQQIIRSDIESRSLAALRDILLPRLLSGVLRVRDAKSAIEQVA